MGRICTGAVFLKVFAHVTLKYPSFCPQMLKPILRFKEQGHLKITANHGSIQSIDICLSSRTNCFTCYEGSAYIIVKEKEPR